MSLALALAPLLVAAGLLGLTRLPSWMAAAGALLAALPALLSGLPVGTGALESVVAESLRGAWLAWQAVSVMLAGLFFHAATRREGGARVAPPDAAELFTLVMFVGPFVESAVGFGVGIVVVLGRLRAAGTPPVTAALLSLLSQTLVPWGAFGVGTLIGAEVADIAFPRLALASALLSLPLLLAWLPFYWRLARTLGAEEGAGPRRRAGELAWTLVAGAALVLANAALDPQLAVVVAIGAVIAVRRLLHRPSGGASPEPPALWREATALWPYVALCVVLLASRTIEPLGRVLAGLGRVRPFAGEPAFAPLHHPSFWLLAIGAGAALARGRSVPAALAETFARGWRPVLVTVLFVVLARWMLAAGSAELVAARVISLLGANAPLASPVLAALAGVLCGSNAASNALMMPVQSALGAAGSVPALLVAAVQNVGGSALTALSPARIVFASSLAGGLDERVLYRRAARFALPPLLVTAASVGVALVLGRL